MSLKLDLHVHSISQGKIYIDDKQLKQSLKQSHLDGVAVTNFFDISHALWLKERLKEFVIIVGQEVWTQDGHIIGLGIKKRIKDYQSAEDTIHLIHEQGGIAVAPHPFISLGLGHKAKHLPVDAIEVYNALMGMTFIFNYFAHKMAKKIQKSQLASTDTMRTEYLGRSYTEVITNDSRQILDTIRSGNVNLHKKALPFPFLFLLKNFLNARNLEPCYSHPVPCYICEKSTTIRIFKKKFKCVDCGVVHWSRLSCCNGHYICKKCILTNRGPNTHWDRKIIKNTQSAI